MKPPIVVYLVARTHGLKTHLLKSEQIVNMSRSKDLTEICDFLLKTGYSKELGKIPIEEVDASRLERIFYQKLSGRLFFLLSITSGKIRMALEDYCRKIDVENLKTITRAIHAHEKIGEDRLIPIPRKYQTVNFAVLLQSQNLQEMVTLLRASSFKSLADVMEVYEKYGNPLVIEAQADKACYEKLWKDIGQIQEKHKIRTLVETEIDLKNLLLLLSLKYMNVDIPLIQKIMINIRHKLPRDLVQQFGTVSFDSIPDFLTWPPYKELAKKTVDLISKGLLNDVENIFSRFTYSNAEAATLRNPNSLTYVFAYMQLCFREARNLTTLATGKQLKLDDEKIRSVLFL